MLAAWPLISLLPICLHVGDSSSSSRILQPEVPRGGRRQTGWQRWRQWGRLWQPLLVPESSVGQSGRNSKGVGGNSQGTEPAGNGKMIYNHTQCWQPRFNTFRKLLGHRFLCICYGHSSGRSLKFASYFPAIFQLCRIVHRHKVFQAD